MDRLIILFLFTSLYTFANLQTNNSSIIVENVQEVPLDIETFEDKTAKKIEELLLKKRKFLLLSKNQLKKYYKKNQYRPFWIEEEGVKSIALELLEKIKYDPVLKPYSTKAFKLDEVIVLLNSLDESPEKYLESMISIDFMLTQVYHRYMRYLSKGSINWKKFKKELWQLKKKKEIIAAWDKFDTIVDSIKLLIESVENNNLSLALSKVDFTYPYAKNLVDAMIELEKLASQGGYVKLPKFKVLRVGDTSDKIALLRKRLLQSNDLKYNCTNTIGIETLVMNNSQEEKLNPIDIILEKQNHTLEEETTSCEEYFDEDLKEAVISFQKKHGLSADGVVGANTLKRLNIPVEKKIEQIRLNLERMRWLPRNLGDKYLLINIPEYKLKMLENGNIRLKMPVVVGDRKHPTPIFSNQMSYIVLNPYWKIPKRIVKKEIIPKLEKDPTYLRKKGINIHENWSPNSTQYEIEQLTFTNYITTQAENSLLGESIIQAPTNSFENLNSFRFIQKPSKNNPLGRMKFMFPNKHSVYLHDTPAKSLFSRAQRAFSHGCIRLGKPQELLKIIVDEYTSIDYTKATHILKDIEKKDIGLKQKIPVHIVYLTSWVDEEGELHFRDDIYKYDKMQKRLMF